MSFNFRQFRMQLKAALDAITSNAAAITTNVAADTFVDSYVQVQHMGNLTAEQSIAASGSQYWELVITSVGQTNFLPEPNFTGQRMQFYVSKHSGANTRIINASCTLDYSGDHVMTFPACGGFIDLIGYTSSGNIRWQILNSSVVSVTAS